MYMTIIQILLFAPLVYVFLFLVFVVYMRKEGMNENQAAGFRFISLALTLAYIGIALFFVK